MGTRDALIRSMFECVCLKNRHKGCADKRSGDGDIYSRSSLTRVNTLRCPIPSDPTVVDMVKYPRRTLERILISVSSSAHPVLHTFAAHVRISTRISYLYTHYCEKVCWWPVWVKYKTSAIKLVKRKVIVVTATPRTFHDRKSKTTNPTKTLKLS